MQRIDSYWVSLAGMVVGTLMLVYGLANNGVVLQSWVGTALICTGMVTLTIGEVFRKN